MIGRQFLKILRCLYKSTDLMKNFELFLKKKFFLKKKAKVGNTDYVKWKCLQHYKEAPNLIFFVASTGAFSSWVKWKWVHCATHKLRIWSTKWSIHWKKESHFGKIRFWPRNRRFVVIVLTLLIIFFFFFFRPFWK